MKYLWNQYVMLIIKMISLPVFGFTSGLVKMVQLDHVMYLWNQYVGADNICVGDQGLNRMWEGEDRVGGRIIWKALLKESVDSQ